MCLIITSQNCTHAHLQMFIAYGIGHVKLLKWNVIKPHHDQSLSPPGDGTSAHVGGLCWHVS